MTSIPLISILMIVLARSQDLLPQLPTEQFGPQPARCWFNADDEFDRLMAAGRKFEEDGNTLQALLKFEVAAKRARTKRSRSNEAFALEFASDMARTLGRLYQAKAHCDRAYTLRVEDNDKTISTLDQLRQARVAFDLGHYADAMELGRQVAESFKGTANGPKAPSWAAGMDYAHYQGLILRARSLARLGKGLDGAALLDKPFLIWDIVSHNNDALLPQIELATIDCYLTAGKPDDAIRIARKLVEDSKQSDTGTAELALAMQSCAYLLKGDFPKSSECTESLAAMAEANLHFDSIAMADVLRGMSRINAEGLRGLADSIEKALTQIRLSKSPDSPKVQLNYTLFKLYDYLGEPDRMRQKLDDILAAVVPGNPVQQFFVAACEGRLAEIAGQPDQALSIYSKARKALAETKEDRLVADLDVITAHIQAVPEKAYRGQSVDCVRQEGVFIDRGLGWGSFGSH